MTAGAFGKDFLKNLDRELNRQSIPGSERGKDRPVQRRAQSAIPGAPGSPERLEYAVNQIEDPQLRGQLVSELAWGQVGTHLQNALHAIKRDESREDFYDYDDPPYSPETVEQFASAARMLAKVGDPNLYAAFANELGEDSPLHEYLGPVTEYAVNQGTVEALTLGHAYEQARLDGREKLLQREYAQIERRTGQAGLETADQAANQLAQHGLLYDPNVTDDQLRADLRSAAEHGKAYKTALAKGAFLAEFDKEVARNHGPGSSWNDEQRAQWEAELRQGTVEVVEREIGRPEDAADRAILGMIVDDRRQATGKGALERGIDAELERMAEHDSRAPHKRAMADELVKEWNATHTATGDATTAIDGLGREHGGRYD